MAYRALSPLDRFLLARLRRFARLSEKADVPQWRRLARHATVGAYRECTRFGLEDEARSVLNDVLKETA